MSEPALVIGELRDGPLRYLDQVTALEQTGERRYSYTYFRWTRRGFVGDRPGTRRPHTWDEIVERYERIEIKRRGCALEVAYLVGMTLLVAVAAAILAVEVHLWAAGAYSALAVLVVFLRLRERDSDSP